MEDSELENFIEQIVRKSQESSDYDRPLTEEELKELAFSMGLTEKQWKELQRRARVHVYAAESFLRREEYANGIEEAKKGVAINPYVLNGYSYLALGYFQKFQDTGLENDRVQAEFAARKALELNPYDQKMINIISAIAKKNRVVAKDKKQLIIVGVALVLVLAAGIMVFALNQSANEDIETRKSNDQLYRNQLIEAEEEVLRIRQEIRVELERKHNLIPPFLDLIPKTNEFIKWQAEYKLAILNEDYILADEIFNRFRNVTFQEANSESIELQLVQIEGAENRIAFQRGELAKAIKNYNILVKKYGDQFPEFELKNYESN